MVEAVQINLGEKLAGQVPNGQSLRTRHRGKEPPACVFPALAQQRLARRRHEILGGAEPLPKMFVTLQKRISP